MVANHMLGYKVNTKESIEHRFLRHTLNDYVKQWPKTSSCPVKEAMLYTLEILMTFSTRAQDVPWAGGMVALRSEPFGLANVVMENGPMEVGPRP